MRNISTVLAGTLLLIACCSNTPELYEWERDRDAVRPITDMAICYGGDPARKPYLWDKERFGKTVLYKDESGKEHWLFDNMIMMELWTDNYGVTYSIANDGRFSSRKEHWQQQLDYWFAPDYGFAALDACIADASDRIGPPPTKRGVVFSLPDPVYFEHYSDAMKGVNRNTVYWGEIDGVQMDFSRPEDRVKAYRWMVDEVRRHFDKAGYRHIELLGFYVLSEELSVPGSFRYEYKEHDKTIRALADYCHSVNEGLFWVPYAMAPGHDRWREMGFDLVVMQPNRYWKDAAWTWEQIGKAIEDNGLGMELEFEGSHGEPLGSSVLSRLSNGAPNPHADANKARFEEYLDYAVVSGIYGTRPLVLYSGTDALYELAVSEDEKDRSLYHRLGQFIAGNPLKGGVYTLKDDKVEVKVGTDGRLVSLTNLATGHNYAGGGGLWRLFYNTHEEKEMQVDPAENMPVVTCSGNVITIAYRNLRHRGQALDMELMLKVSLKDGQVRFGSSLVNNQPHTIVRELQYPLVGDMNLPDGHKLLTTHTGGQVFDDPLATIVNVNPKTLYMKPDQYFRQYDLQYPRHAASNCYAFFGDEDGLYFGSHDESLQQTWHGLRAYPSAPGRFDRLEAGFYRYPNAMCGDSWSCDASVIKPYSGSWTETSRIYRKWIDSWWDKREVPSWVNEMTGWQRIIFKHQYGEYLRRYADLPGRINDCGKSVGCNAVLAFGWWSDGMDNGYPNYYIDETQGGEDAWKKAISDYRADGNRLILYYNGRLIDRESDFYLHGDGRKTANKDNTGAEFAEHYKFTGEGTSLGYYDTRTFSIANMADRQWRDMLIDWADRAMEYGADAVFYDQLGVAEEFPNWDRSREFPVQDVFTGRYKAEALKEIRDHIKAVNPDFCLGTEWLSDCTAQFCDFVHIVEFTALPESFPEWFRYTFPEVIWSDRCVRDDTDIERRVNNTLLKGLVNDIEVFRCRGLIDETPHYQQYLAKINAIRHKYPQLLLGAGTFVHTDGFSCSSDEISARGYRNGDSLAIVVTTLCEDGAKGRLDVPGYRFVEHSAIGDVKVSSSGTKLSLGQHGIAVLVFEKL